MESEIKHENLNIVVRACATALLWRKIYSCDYRKQRVIYDFTPASADKVHMNLSEVNILIIVTKSLLHLRESHLDNITEFNVSDYSNHRFLLCT